MTTCFGQQLVHSLCVSNNSIHTCMSKRRTQPVLHIHNQGTTAKLGITVLPSLYPSSWVCVPESLSACRGQLWGKTLEHDLKGDLGGDLEHFFVAIVQVAVDVDQRQTCLAAELFSAMKFPLSMLTHWSLYIYPRELHALRILFCRFFWTGPEG